MSENNQIGVAFDRAIKPIQPKKTKVEIAEENAKRAEQTANEAKEKLAEARLQAMRERGKKEGIDFREWTDRDFLGIQFGFFALSLIRDGKTNGADLSKDDWLNLFSAELSAKNNPNVLIHAQAFADFMSPKPAAESKAKSKS